jgi:hypothetical protein
MKTIVLLFVLGISTFAAASEFANAQGLAASQIVEKNVAARGGLDAWRKIQSMVWVGHIESTNAPGPSLPFDLDMKRPNKTRFLIKAQSQTSVRIFDGIHGWTLRPSIRGEPEAQPYTPQELNFAREGQGFDGPLIDYQAKGISVSLEGVDEIEGRKAYRLNVKLPSGDSHHVWVDAKSFLDVKYDRASHDAYGRSNMVSVFYRDYETIDGLQIPLMIETSTNTAKAMEKLVIDRVLVNPPLEDRIFVKPFISGWHSAATIDIGSTRPVRPPMRPRTAMPTGYPDLRIRSVPGPGVTQ